MEGWRDREWVPDLGEGFLGKMACGGNADMWDKLGCRNIQGVSKWRDAGSVVRFITCALDCELACVYGGMIMHMVGRKGRRSR